MTDGANDELTSLVEGWYLKDRPAAVAFALANTDDGGFEEAQTALASLLFRDSRDEAREFLVQLPAETRHRAIGEMTTTRIGGELRWLLAPDTVASWLLTLPGDTWKDAVGVVLDDWQRTDYVGMWEWIAKLSATERDKVIMSLRSW